MDAPIQILLGEVSVPQSIQYCSPLPCCCKPQELIWVSTPRLAAEISVLVFVIAAYSGGRLKDTSMPA